MKHHFLSLVTLVAAIFSTNAKAATPDALKAALQATTACQNFVRADDAYMYLGFGPYLLQAEDPRHHIPGTVTVVSLAHPDQQLTLHTFDSAIDAMTVDGRLFILTYDAIEEWDRLTWTRVGVYPSSTIRVPLHYRQHATEFALHNNQFIISHGREGFSTFDIATRKPIGETALLTYQLPLESDVRAVTVDGDTAIFTVDQFTLVDQNGNQPSAFSGLVVYDLAAKKVINRVAGVSEGSEDIHVEGAKVFINYGAYTWILNRADLQKRKVTRPEQLVSQWDGLKGAPTGKPLYDSENLYTCFNKQPATQGVQYPQVPEVLSRTDLKM